MERAGIKNASRCHEVGLKPLREVKAYCGCAAGVTINKRKAHAIRERVRVVHPPCATRIRLIEDDPFLIQKYKRRGDTVWWLSDDRKRSSAVHIHAPNDDLMTLCGVDLLPHNWSTYEGNPDKVCKKCIRKEEE